MSGCSASRAGWSSKDVRAALGLSPGDRLHLHVTGQRLTWQRQQDAIDDLRALGAEVWQKRSLVEELLAMRRTRLPCSH